jgi:sortase A
MTEVIAPDVIEEAELMRSLESTAADSRPGPWNGAEDLAGDAGTPDHPEKAAGDAQGVGQMAKWKRTLQAGATSAGKSISRNRSAIAAWAGGTLCALALFCLLFVGYLAGFSRVEMSRAQTHLIGALNGVGGYASFTGVVPAEGEPAGVITIPAIGLNDVVVTGTSAQDLEEGPGYLLGSAPPGTRGNTVIAGKRASFGAPFGDIGALRPNDSIVVVSSLGSFTYKVASAGSALPGWRDPAGPEDQAQLTLVTADSSLFPDGLEYVVATLVGKPVAYVSARAIVPPSGNFGLSGDGGLLLPTFIWFLLLAGVSVGTVIAIGRCRKRMVVYVLATPLILALCMLVFHDLSGLLPATL